MVYDEIVLLRDNKIWIASLIEKWARRFFINEMASLPYELVQLETEKTERQKAIENLYKFEPWYEKVETVYRLLKSNYEEKKDFKRVGDFHYGEMQMRRLADPWSSWWSCWLPLTWRNLYWALNG